MLDISAREQRRIGQDLHDGLGPAPDRHRLHEQGTGAAAGRISRSDDAAEAAKIVKLVNEAIQKTRELARGLLPVVSEAHGLMAALHIGPARSSDLFPRSLPLRVRRPVLIHDDRVARPSVSHRAGSGQQRDQARPCANIS